MTHLLDRLLGLHGPALYLIVGALVFAEDALFVGFVLPGETAAILGGVAARFGHASLPVMLLVVIAAAIVGDSVGYEVGSRFGSRLLGLRVLRRHQSRLDDARDLLAHRGGFAVFFGRFIAFFRATMPALAGASHMPYRRFLRYNIAGGLVWGTGCVLLGYLAGSSYAALEKTAGHAVAIATAAVVVVALVAWRIRRYRAERRDRHIAGS